MARLWMAGAELTGAVTTADGAPDGVSSNGAVTRDTGTFRSGVASYKIDSVGGVAASFNGPVQTARSLTIYLRAYLNTSSTPTTTRLIVQFGNNTGIEFRSDGAVDLLVDNVVRGSASSAVNDGQWHRLEISITSNGTDNITAAELQVDGTSIATFSGSATAGSASYTPIFGWQNSPGASKTMFMDDLAINNSSGGSNNSFPGSGVVLLLKPSTDSAVGAGWTLGTGTAIAGNSGATAIKNTPPLGVADLAAGSDVKQIRNASSNTADYDTGLDSYTTAGVPTGATVNAVMPFIITGAPSATGAKSGSLVLVSNPAGGTDSHGTYRAGVNAGTYPTGWKATQGTIQEAPTVTLGTSPVLRADITSGTAARVAMVCSMGMYVDYTPAVSFIEAPALQALQAVNRAATW